MYFLSLQYIVCSWNMPDNIEWGLQYVVCSWNMPDNTERPYNPVFEWYYYIQAVLTLALSYTGIQVWQTSYVTKEKPQNLPLPPHVQLGHLYVWNKLALSLWLQPITPPTAPQWDYLYVLPCHTCATLSVDLVQPYQHSVPDVVYKM